MGQPNQEKAVQAEPSDNPKNFGQILASTDTDAIADVLRQVLQQKIRDQYYETHPNAAQLFLDLPDILAQKGGEDIFKARFSALTHNSKMMFARFGLVDNLADQAAKRIALLNIPDDREHNPYHLQSVLQIAKAAGLEPEYTERVLSSVWKGYTATPHPTGYLDETAPIDENQSGVDLFMDLIDIDVFHSGYDVPKGQLYGEVESAIDALLSSDHLTPTRRSTTLEEITFVSRFGLKYVNARTRALDAVQADHEAVFGPRDNSLQAPNFTRRECKMDMTLRAWQGGDYDGKPNAEHWTLMAGQVASTYMAVSNHLWRLEQASRYLNNEERRSLGLTFDEAWARPGAAIQTADMHHELRQLHALLADLKTDLFHIFTDIENAMNAITNPDLSGQQRAEKFKALDAHFVNVKTRMESLYDNRRFNKRTLASDRGLHVYDNIVREFKRLRTLGNAKDHWPDEATTLFEDAAEDLRMDGMALFKIEPRHNHAVNNQIVDNLFNLQAFRKYTVQKGIMALDDFRFIDAKGGISQLDLEDQHRIYAKVSNAMAKNGTLRAFLYEANPEGYDDNGYPLQTYGTLRRLEVMEMYQLKFGPMAIIAEADECGEGTQSFIFSSFNLSLMVHTPLNEEHKTILATHESIEGNHEHGALERIQKRARSNVPTQFKRAGRANMFARSDITRQFGQFSGPLVYGQAQKNAETSARLGQPSYAYEGSGQSNERGGGDPMVMVRLIAQSLQEYQEMTGEKLSDEILSMAASVIHTVQGREMYKTEAEIEREMKNQLAEMIGIRLELDGHVKKGTFIPQKKTFSPVMEKFLRSQMNKMMQSYSNMRDAQHPDSDDAVIDLLALIASDPDMAGNTNNAARMLSKSAGNKAKKLTQQRAIGNNIWIALMRTHHDGWYTVGKFMEELHEALHKGFTDENCRPQKLAPEDIEGFMDSEYWNYNLFVRSLTPVARANFEHSARRLGMAESWDHDRLMKQGRSVRVDKNGKLVFAKVDNITPEQAYFSGLYRDAQQFVSASNALADGSFITIPDFKRIEAQAGQGRQKGDLSVRFDSASLQRWDFLGDVQASTRRSIPALAAMDMFQADISNGVEHSQADLRAIGSWYRSTSVTPNEHIVIDYKASYGRRQAPLPEDAAEVLASHAADPYVPANDDTLDGVSQTVDGIKNALDGQS